MPRADARRDASAGESCTAVVRFTPTVFFAGEEQTGSLSVTATDPATGVVKSALVPVSGRGKLPTCLGVAATIVGTQLDERIEGTPGDDVIVGLGGRDIVERPRGERSRLRQHGKRRDQRWSG